MDLKDTYNKIADDWHKDHALDDWGDPGMEVFLSLLKPGAAILDVGCGGGLKTKVMASQGFSVTGVDLSESFIEIARREVPGARLRFLICRRARV